APRQTCALHARARRLASAATGAGACARKNHLAGTVVWGMLRSYVAYGLQLRCSFAPAGMPERRAAGLPQLSVRLRAGEQLEQLWSGSREPPLWRGRLGDDRPLTLERGTAGDLLFTYADRARFLLDPERGRLDCAPAACARDALDWQQVLL